VQARRCLPRTNVALKLRPSNFRFVWYGVSPPLQSPEHNA